MEARGTVLPNPWIASYAGDCEVYRIWTDLSSGEFPQQYGEAPHVGGLHVPLGGRLLQRLGRHPRRRVQPALLLERELRVRHVDARC